VARELAKKWGHPRKEPSGISFAVPEREHFVSDKGNIG
jgi:hypothetical protein